MQRDKRWDFFLSINQAREALRLGREKDAANGHPHNSPFQKDGVSVGEPRHQMPLPSFPYCRASRQFHQGYPVVH